MRFKCYINKVHASKTKNVVTPEIGFRKNFLLSVKSQSKQAKAA